MPFHHTPVLFVDKVLIHKTDDSVLGVGLVPYDSRNIIVAGRSVCADEAAFGTVRVMAVCMAMGQAAGTAAAIGSKKGLTMSRMDIPLLVQTLKEQGAVIDFENCK